MEQSYEGGSTGTKHTSKPSTYYHGASSNPAAVNGYYQSDEKYHSPRHNTPNGGHAKPVKGPVGPFYHNMYNPSMQSPYNPAAAMMHMNGRYYNPHIINPPLPPLPPTSPSPASNGSNYVKPTDGNENNHQDTPTYHRTPHHYTQPPTHHSGNNNMEGIKCHRCGEKGHIAPICPTKRAHSHHGYTKHQSRVCKYWLNGHCQKGDDCLFVHGMYPDPNLMYQQGVPMHTMPVPHYKMPPQQAYPLDPNAYYYPPIPQPNYVYDPNAPPPSSNSPAASKSVPSTGVAPQSDPSYEYPNATPTDPYHSSQQAYTGSAPYYGQPVQYDGYNNYAYPGNAATPDNGQGRQYSYQQHPNQQQQGNYYNNPYSAQVREVHAAQYPPPATEPTSRSSSIQSVATSDAASVNPSESKDEEQSTDNAMRSATTTTDNLAIETAIETLAIADLPPPTSSASSSVHKPSPTDSTAAVKGKKKKRNKQSQAASTPLTSSVVDNSATVSEKGLRNDTGENNCFLNVVVQALYHLETFQDSLAKVDKHTCAGDGRCVYCALTSVFSLLAESGDMSPVSSESLRKVLSAISTSPLPTAEERYKAGSMDDAAEAHETIVRSLHEALTTASAPCNCLVHDVFGLYVGEEASCRQCGMKMETQPYDAMVLHVATEAIKEELAKKPKTSKSFETLLSAVWAVAGSSKKCSGCRHDKVYESSLQLKQVPRMFTLGLTWKNNPAHMATLKLIVSSIEPTINLGRVFPNMVAENLLSAGQGDARLMGMYCFFGHHYMAFIYKAATQEWLSFNDTVVKRVGSQWGDVQKACLENHYQPYVLFYDVEQPKQETGVVQFTIGDFVMSVASEIDQENWRSCHDDTTKATGETQPPIRSQGKVK
ncbi:hypothetical protein AeMF1_015519 [Aphanomyces euteiches]|nr:hypothetical protein AeMF1_015519 [Aphanomyces euteiches]